MRRAEQVPGPFECVGEGDESLQIEFASECLARYTGSGWDTGNSLEGFPDPRENYSQYEYPKCSRPDEKPEFSLYPV